MKIKKYVVTDMQEAMQRIRQELGPDAVIINTAREPLRSIRQLFTRRKIEVTAAVDDAPAWEPQQPQLFASDTARTCATNHHVDGTNSTLQPVIPGHTQPAKPEPILSIASAREKNWFGLMLQREMDKETEPQAHQKSSDVGSGQADALVSRWEELLSQAEVNEAVIQALLQDFREYPWETSPSDDLFQVHLKAKIVQLVQPAYDRLNNTGSRIYTFIGPTGVGKTLTLTKLATRLKLTEQKQIALIAVFNHRFGAMEKLSFYGNIIGVPVEIVMTPAELARAVENHRDKDVVFIDTDGRPSKNQSQVLELNSFLGVIDEPQQIRLVLGTPTKNRDLIRIAQDFKPVGYNGLIMTKTDETDTYGSILNLICDTGVPVLQITNGQNVPDDIKDINAQRLADFILKGIVPNENF